MNNFPPTPPNQIASNPNKSKVSEHYKVIELLGKGSYGSAYLVEGETTHVCIYIYIYSIQHSFTYIITYNIYNHLAKVRYKNNRHIHNVR
jgi:hypothetical protein